MPLILAIVNTFLWGNFLMTAYQHSENMNSMHALYENGWKSGGREYVTITESYVG